MAHITVRLPDELDERLDHLCEELERKKSYIIKQALEEYLNEREDYLIALARLSKPSGTMSLEEVEQELGLEH